MAEKSRSGHSRTKSVGGKAKESSSLKELSPSKRRTRKRKRTSKSPSKLREGTSASSVVQDATSPEKKATMSRNLAKSITELVETEAAYVADLETLVERIMKPMGEKKDFMTGTPLVTKEQMECIWSNLTLIPPINAILLKKMQEGLDKYGAESDKMASVIGEAFLEVADYMQIYTRFCANQALSTSTLLELQKNTQFEAFLMEKGDVAVMEESHNLNLNAFLIKPVQRVCKYPLFLRDLLGYMLPSHPAFDTLLQAKEKISAVVARINENKRKAENTMKLREVSELIGNCPEPVMAPSRTVVKKGFVKIAAAKKKTTASILCVCNDVVVAGKEGMKAKVSKKKKGRFKCFIFDSLSLVEVAPQDDCTFTLTTPKSSWTVAVEDKAERDKWIVACQKSIAASSGNVLLRPHRLPSGDRPASCKF